MATGAIRASNPSLPVSPVRWHEPIRAGPYLKYGIPAGVRLVHVWFLQWHPTPNPIIRPNEQNFFCQRGKRALAGAPPYQGGRARCQGPPASGSGRRGCNAGYGFSRVRHGASELPAPGPARVVRVPWEDGKQRATKALGWFLSGWARRLSRKEAPGVFGVSWDRVHRAVGMAVAWNRECLSLEGGFPVKPHRGLDIVPKTATFLPHRLRTTPDSKRLWTRGNILL